MKKNLRYSALVTVTLSAVIMLFGNLAVLPWWSFLAPVMLTGMLIQARQWKIPFITIGFLSGFIVWLGANVYYDLTLNNLILNKIALLFTVPKIVVLLMAGATGGLLTALALFSGKLLWHKTIL
jgi:hypothetical protein